jgi:hypothetical protein
MADRDLIHSYLDALAQRLPSEAVEELADGREETFQRYLGVVSPQLRRPTRPLPSSAGQRRSQRRSPPVLGPTHRVRATCHRPGVRSPVGYDADHHAGLELADPDRCRCRLRRHPGRRGGKSAGRCQEQQPDDNPARRTAHSGFAAAATAAPPRPPTGSPDRLTEGLRTERGLQLAFDLADADPHGA